jgi:Bacterial membrane protein YfhO
VIAVFGLVFFARLVVRPTWLLYSDFSDLLAYQIPQMRFLVSSWQETGELPLWCPYSFAGMPFIADLQVAAFYPPHVLLYFLPQQSIGPALSWLIVAHVIVAGWAMFAYARSQELNRTCALIAALGYMFAGKWLLHLLVAGQYVTIGLAWLPLVLLLLDRGVGRGGLLAATWAGVVLALVVLGSHPQFSFYAGLVIVLWTLPTALEQAGLLDPGCRSWGKIVLALLRWSGAVAWCGIVALALVAVQLLPTLEAAAQTTRGSAGVGFDPKTDLLLTSLGLIGPPPGGLPTLLGWEFRTGWTVLWVATAAIAPGLARGRARLKLQAGICLALIVFGLGGAALFQGLPGFRLFRIPSRMFLLTALPIALLVGAATQILFEAPRSDPGLRRAVGRALAVVLMVGLVTTASLAWTTGRPPGAPLLVYGASLLLTVPLACWVLWRLTQDEGRSSRRTARFYQLAWGILLAADLFAMGWSLVAVRPQTPIYAPSACVRLLLERRQDHERVLDREVPGELGSTPLCFALPSLHRLDPVRGYNPLDIRRYKEYVQFISDRDEPVRPDNRIGNFPILNKNLLDLLGARFLLQPRDLQPIDGEPIDIAHDPRWQELGEDPTPEAHLFVPGGLRRLPPYALYENRQAFPRAFVVPRAEPLPERDHVLKVLKQADLRRVVFLEEFHPEPGSSPSSGGFQPAVIVAYLPNHVVIDVDLAAPGYLVLTDPWYPGWKCTVDGRPASIYRADYVFRAVSIPAGKHRARFSFEPDSSRRGRIITGIALAAVLILGVVALARSSRRGQGELRTIEPVLPEKTNEGMVG